MKYIVYGISLAVITMLVLVITLEISGRNVRKNEIETALNTAVEQSLEQLKSKKGYKIETYQELIADFNQIFLLQMESNTDIQVDILTVDVKKGVLDVKITGTYLNIMGKKQKEVCRKSVILEEYSQKKAYYKITFLVDGKVYHRYSICEGGTAVLPKIAKKAGKNFQYWTKQGENYKYDLEHIPIKGDLTLEAVFR